LSDDGQYFSAVQNDTLALWDTTSGTRLPFEVKTITNSSSERIPTVKLDFSPDRNLLGACVEDKVYLWRIQPQELLGTGRARGEQCATIEVEREDLIATSFTTRIDNGGFIIRLWRVQNSILEPFDASEVVSIADFSAPNNLDFSQDLQILIGGTDLREISYWNVNQLDSPRGIIRTGNDSDYTLMTTQFNDDGTRIISVHDDGTVIFRGIR
jgi:WD40 repeat protein